MKMKRYLSVLSTLALAYGAPALAIAQDAAVNASSAGTISLAAAVLLGLAAAAGVLAQGKAVTSALDSIGRNPGAAGKLFLPMILGLAFIESLVVISFVVANQLLAKF
jgi:F-type H+-transporting ATPase subunit c